jgi:hypothetical protein
MSRRCGSCDGFDDAHDEECPAADARTRMPDESSFRPSAGGKPKSYQATFKISQKKMDDLLKQATHYADGRIGEFLQGSVKYLILGALIEREMMCANIGGRSGASVRLGAVKHHEELINKINEAYLREQQKDGSEKN